MRKRPFLRVLFTIILAATWLLGYPFLHDQSPWLQAHFRNYGTVKKPVPPKDSLPIAPVDSLFLQDTLPQQDSSLVVFATPAPLQSNIIPPLIGTYSGLFALDSFFAALRQPERQVRIAYYGDSSIEGDLITMTFRDSLQRRFGGQGVGFVPIMSHIPGFRRSVRHYFSDNWYRNVIGEPNKEKLLRGISGEYFLPAVSIDQDSSLLDSLANKTPTEDDYWVSYRGSRWFAGTQSFSRARFFYGRPQPNDSLFQPIQLSVKTSHRSASFPLTSNQLINEISLTDTLSQNIQLTFSSLNRTPLYGVSLESEKGVIVDNFPCRGNSGRANLGISRSVLSAFQEKMDYDLIILQYGLNVINPRVKKYDWYERQLIQVVKHFQTAMPGVSILIVGVPDKGTKINGIMQTDPSVPRVTNTQRKVAEKTGVAFFSFYEAMGGAGSMVKWVEQSSPRLANTDYTHFNFKGAQKASDMLLSFLLDAFEAAEASGGSNPDRAL